MKHQQVVEKLKLMISNLEDVSVEEFAGFSCDDITHLKIDDAVAVNVIDDGVLHITIGILTGYTGPAYSNWELIYMDRFMQPQSAILWQEDDRLVGDQPSKLEAFALSSRADNKNTHFANVISGLIPKRTHSDGWPSDMTLNGNPVCPYCNHVPLNILEVVSPMFNDEYNQSRHIPDELIFTCFNPECDFCDQDFSYTLKVTIDMIAVPPDGTEEGN